MSMHKCPISETLQHHTNLHPDSIAVVSSHLSSPANRLTYKQLFDDASSIATALTSYPSSSPLAFTASLTASFLSAWWGARLAGVPILLEHPHDSPDRLSKNRAAAGVGGVLRLVNDGPSCRYEIEQLAEASPLPTNAAVLIATSGSSGTPKIIPLTAQQLLASASRVNEKLGVTSNSAWLLSLMPAHIGGLSIIVRAVVAGCAVVIPPDLKRPTLNKITHEHSVTHLSLVPSVAEEFIGLGPLPESLKALLLGGERITTTQRRALSSVPQCYLSYGATETASCIAVARLSEIAQIPDSVGFPLSDTIIRIRDEHGELCSIGKSGLVEVIGPTISAQEYDADSEHKIWRSADRGYLDDSGLLHILGRTDDVIISGGVKISSHEIVDAAAASNLVTEAAVIKSPDNQWGERAILFVTAPPKTSAEALYHELREKLGALRAPREIIILAVFPRTSIGKINRAALSQYRGDSEDVNRTLRDLVRDRFLR